jgi:hypothetical protein
MLYLRRLRIEARRIGFTSTAIDVADGTSSRSNPSRFASSSPLTVATPVVFPPRLLRLASTEVKCCRPMVIGMWPSLREAA